MRKITVRDVLLQTVVSLVNLGGQRLGLAPDPRDARDLGQARTAIEAVRVLLPLLEEEEPEQVRPVRDALAQLQMAYARERGAPTPGAQGERGPEAGDAESARAGGEQAPGPAGSPERAGDSRQTRSGRLWVPPGSGVP